MAGHTSVDARTRKYATLLAGEFDLDQTFFDVMVTVAAGAASTAIISANQIPSNRRLYIYGFTITSDGAAWTTGTNIKLQSSGAVDLVTVLTANLPTSTASVSTAPAKGTTTVADAIYAGLADGTGLNLVQTGTYAGAAILKVRVWGALRSSSVN